MDGLFSHVIKFLRCNYLSMHKMQRCFIYVNKRGPDGDMLVWITGVNCGFDNYNIAKHLFYMLLLYTRFFFMGLGLVWNKSLIMMISGVQLNTNLSHRLYTDSHYKDKKVWWLFYLYDGNPSTKKDGLYRHWTLMEGWCRITMTS